MSKKRRDKDFLGDINEAMNLVGLYTKGLTYYIKVRGQTPKLTFKKRAAFTAGSGKPYRADDCRGVGKGVNIKCRMGRDSWEK